MNADLDSIKLNVHQPREAFAAVTFLLGKVVENSLVIQPQAVTGTNSFPTARLPLPSLTKSTAMPLITEYEFIASVKSLVKQLLLADAKNFLFMFVAGSSGIESRTVAAADINFAERIALEELVLRLMSELEQLCINLNNSGLPLSVQRFRNSSVVHIIHDGEAKTITPNLEVAELGDYQPYGDILESNFAANVVCSGRELIIDSAKNYRPSATASELLIKRLAKGLNFELKPIDPKKTSAIFSDFLALGGAQPKFFDCQSPKEVYRKYELVKQLMLASLNPEGRDQLLIEIMRLMSGEERTIERVVATLMNDHTFSPDASLNPGGSTYTVLTLWEEFWRFTSSKPVDLKIKQGFGHLAAISAYFLWWSGRFAQSHELSTAILKLDPSNNLAQLVLELGIAQISPPWLGSVVKNRSL